MKSLKLVTITVKPRITKEEDLVDVDIMLIVRIKKM